MCKKSLSVENFKSNKKRSDGLQSQCVACHKQYRKQHYLNNRRKYLDKAAVIKQGMVRWWKEYKKQFVCVRCGEDHPACIQFHHPNDDKEAGVADLVRGGCKERILKEISKCIPMCANCHAKEHWKE